jgi:hypothetical protein
MARGRSVDMYPLLTSNDIYIIIANDLQLNLYENKFSTATTTRE